MWVSVHVYVGLAIAALLREPAWLVAVVALGSHAPLDLVPHWDYTQARRALLWGWVDFLGGLATLVVCLLVLHMPFWMVLMGPLSGAPDFDVLVATIRGDDARKWFPSHWDRFPHGRCGPRPGITLQAGILVACAVVLVVARPY